MEYKKGELNPDYLRALSAFITKHYELFINGKYYAGDSRYRFKLLTSEIQKYGDEPKGGPRQQYSWYVNNSHDFLIEDVKLILERLEFIVFEVFKKELKNIDFDTWLKTTYKPKKNKKETISVVDLQKESKPYNKKLNEILSEEFNGFQEFSKNPKQLLLMSGYLYFLSDMGFVLTKFFKFHPEQEYQKVIDETKKNEIIFSDFIKKFDGEDIKFALKFFDEIITDFNVDNNICKSSFTLLYDKVNEYKKLIETKIKEPLRPNEKRIVGSFLFGYFVGSVYFRKRFEILTNKEHLEKDCTTKLENGWESISSRIVKIENGDKIDLCNYEINQILDYSPDWLKSFDELMSESKLNDLELNLKNVELNNDADSMQFLQNVFKSNILPKI